MVSLFSRFRHAALADGDDADTAGIRVLKTVDAMAGAPELDPVVESVKGLIQGLPLGRLRGVLHGRALGHPLHPALVQVPLGTWLSAAVLDLTSCAERPARNLVAVGVVCAAPAALSGWVDWAEQHEQQMRTGLIHAVSMTMSVGLYGGSWAARACGRHTLGRALGFAGLMVAGCGATLGGHIAYRQAAGTNKAEPVPRLVGPTWRSLGPANRFATCEPARRMVGEVPVLVVRDAEDELHVLADRCSHFSGPLSEGTVTDGCITCPWHGSVFRLSDGWNVDGPATAPQPRFETRLDDDGILHVRLPDAGDEPLRP
ncbi:Rieske 2Fe-2S domain-containing protein [Streptomyces sp. NPDC002004]